MVAPVTGNQKRKLTDEEIRQLLLGGRATWAVAAPQQPQAGRRIISGGTIIGVTLTPEMQATAARVRAANPRIFGKSENQNSDSAGNENSNLTGPSDGDGSARGVAAAASNMVGFASAISKGPIGIAIFAAQFAMNIFSNKPKDAFAGPLPLIDRARDLIDKFSGVQPPGSAPAGNPNSSIGSSDALTTTFDTNLPDPRSGQVTELATVEVGGAITPTSGGQGGGTTTDTGAGGFGGGYGGDVPDGGGDGVSGRE